MRIQERLRLGVDAQETSARYKKLWLVVDGENFRVKQSVVLNIKGDIDQFRFFEPKINPPLKDGDFLFNEHRRVISRGSSIARRFPASIGRKVRLPE